MPRVSAQRIAKLRAEVLPLEDFPKDHRDWILYQIEQPKPPAKWLHVGFAWIISRGWTEWHWARGVDPFGTRPPLPKGLREKVIERDGNVCGLCGGTVEPTDIHIDHIKPWSKGGAHVLGNLQVAHSRCNIAKGARDA